MLRSLRIKNLALVVDLTLDLGPGLNVITGETGAGKSILIGALGLVLGERAERNLLRDGEDRCLVEAIFDIESLDVPLDELLEAQGLERCEEGQLILKRVMTSSGSNRQFVNGSPTTLNVLKKLGEWLVDIHGPHDHQSLLHAPNQLEILDAFANLSKPRERLRQLAQAMSGLCRQKADLVIDERTYAQQLDLLQYQAGEIKAARLDPDEEELLQSEYQRTSNAAKLVESVQAAIELLSEREDSILHLNGLLGRVLQDLGRIDPDARPMVDLQEQAASHLQDLLGSLHQYLERIEVNPKRLEEVEERLNLMQSLKRKYGRTIADVIEFGHEAEAKLENLRSRDAELARLNGEMEKLDRSMRSAAQELSDRRREVIPKLARAVSKELDLLGFKQSRFDVVMTSAENASDTEYQIPAAGIDRIEFQFAPNLGEPFRPLRAIASSGELARVMLALKTVLAREDAIPVLVFDEVDANLGGETALVVGQKMRLISDRRQVFCVTHLAQVAAFAHLHYTVHKKVKGGRTISEIARLDENARTREVARMLGGKSEAALSLARTMLNETGTLK